jgi:hypothetical protein
MVCPVLCPQCGNTVHEQRSCRLEYALVTHAWTDAATRSTVCLSQTDCAPIYVVGAADFSNVIKPTQLEKLAEADEHEVVQEVQEYFADYLAQGPSLVTFGITGCVDPGDPRKWNGVQKLARTCDGLMVGDASPFLDFLVFPSLRVCSLHFVCISLFPGLLCAPISRPFFLDCFYFITLWGVETLLDRISANLNRRLLRTAWQLLL